MENSAQADRERPQSSVTRSVNQRCKMTANVVNGGD